MLVGFRWQTDRVLERDLLVVTEEPLNAETKLDRQSGITVPAGRHYVRTHFKIPEGSREVRITAGRPPRPLDAVPVRAGSDVLGLLAVGLDEKSVDSEGRRRAAEFTWERAAGATRETLLALARDRYLGDGFEIELGLSGLVDRLLEEELLVQSDEPPSEEPGPTWVAHRTCPVDGSISL